MPNPILVADIGGTFVRFCLAHPGTGAITSVVQTMLRSGAPDLRTLCARAIQVFGQSVQGAVFAVAGPARNGQVTMTHGGWQINQQDLARTLGIERLVLMNDFAALAQSLVSISEQDIINIQGVNALNSSTFDQQDWRLQGPRVVFGPGTGLGVAVLMHANGQVVTLSSEGGHSSFAPANAFESRVLDYAERRHGRVSWERVLSGPGLELIDAVSRLDRGMAIEPRSAKEIVEAAQAGHCAAAAHSVASFAGLLGSFGGDLALMFGAQGGVYIGGGIALRLASLISLADVRERFNRKGRFSDWLEGVPFAILRDPNATLAGAARAYAGRYPD